MNTTMADGANERLDAQIAEALFGQPGMSKMDVANRVRELRGDGPALLGPREAGQDERSRFEAWYVGNAFDYEKNPIGSRECSLMWKAWQAGLATRQTAGREPVGYLYDWTHSSALGRGEEIFTAFTPDIEAARGSKGAVNIRPVYAAQPSPGGQGEALPPLPKMKHIGRVVGMGPHDTWYEPVAYTAEQMRDYARAALAARQPVELIAKKVGDYRVTVAEDAITVSHGRDIVFAYSAGDPEPINARQPVGEEENVAADTYWTVAGMIEPHIQDGALPASVHDSVAILLDHWLKTCQPVGQEPVAVRVTPEMRAAFRGAFRDGGFWADRLDTALNAMMRAAPPAQAVDLEQSIPLELTPVAAALKRFDECAEDCGSEGCDIGRAWFDALTTMGLLKRTQRSPAVWTMTAEGERLLALIDGKAVGNGR